MRMRMAVWAATLAWLATSCLTIVDAQADDGLDGLEEQAFKTAMAVAEPSLVRIDTVSGLDQVGDLLTGTGPTSGVVVSADGLILTSSFNFISRPASILVTISGGRRFAARQIAQDKQRMLTLLKIDAEGLLPAKPVPKAEISVGQWSLALGRTYDPEVPSISMGIISAVNRIWGKAIQTDAKTSPANYGGALVDLEGRVQGIIVPLSPQGGAESAGVEWYDGGIGFAIPLEDAYSALDRLKSGHDLLPGLMGVVFQRGTSLEAVPIVERVRFDSPAQRAGLQKGDRLVRINDAPMPRVTQVKMALGQHYAGEVLQITYRRGDQETTVPLELAARLPSYQWPYLGVLPQRGETQPAAGAVIRWVIPQSPAAAAGLKPRDVIKQLNDTPVTGWKDLSNTLLWMRPQEVLRLTVVRDGQEQTLEAKLTALPDRVPEEVPTAPAPARPDPPPANPPKTGRITEKLPEHQREYWALVPETYHAAYPQALVLWLQPPGDSMEGELLKVWREFCTLRGAILLAPKTENPNGWTAADAEFVFDCVDHLRQQYTIDEQRMVLHTHAGGGPFGWYLLQHAENPFRAAAISQAPYPGRLSEIEPDRRFQFYCLGQERDPDLKKWTGSIDALRKLNHPLVRRVLPGDGTRYPTAIELEELGRWIDCLDHQ